jgi:hypothetical protein
MQTHRTQCEILKKNEEENIAAYILRVDEIVKIIIGLGETIDEKLIVQEVIRSLPTRFNPKISPLENRKEMDRLTMDELHVILTTYEMRIGQE